MAPNNKTNNTQQAFWVSLGSLFAFGFTLISSMILSRYFSKEDYGTYKQVLYVYNTLLVIFTLGLPKSFSYFLPRIPINEAKDLINKITNIFFILGAIFSLILYISAEPIASFLNNPNLGYALKIFAPVPLLMLPTMGLEGILATYRRTQFLALYNVLSKALMLLCVAVPVAFFKANYIHALIGFSISSFINCLIALYLKFLPVRAAEKQKSSTKYREIIKFSLPLMTASIWGIIISSCDQLFISRFFGTRVFAEFSNGAFELPFTAMVLTATSTVLMPLFSKQVYEKDDPKKKILPIWNSVFEKTSKLIYPLLIFCCFFADAIMVVLYGEQYQNSGIYFRIKLMVNFFTLITYAPLLIAIGATRFYSNVHLYGAIILIIAEYLSVIIFNSPYAIAVISVICQISRTFIMLRYIAIFFGVNLINLFPLKIIFKIIPPSIIILTIISYISIHLLHLEKIILLIVAFFLYVILYSFWAYISKIDYYSIISPLFKR